MNTWVLNPPFLAKFSRAQRSPAVTKSGTLYFPMWLAYVTGVLEQAGHTVRLTDAPARGGSLEDCLESMRDFAPRLVVVDMSTPSVVNDLEVCRAIKAKFPQVFIVAVGTHVSALAEETLRSGEALDAVARREADYTVRDLAALVEKSGEVPPEDSGLAAIEGLSFRNRAGCVVHNPDRPYIENLDELPWLSKVYEKHLDIRDYFNPNAPPPMVTLITSRGCPFRCTYCVYPQTFTGRRYRFRSIKDIVDEMEYVTKAFPQARSIFFEDDTLTANKKRCLELANAIVTRGLKFDWVANSRIEVDYETLKALKTAGCRHLCVGFESGDPGSLAYMAKGTKPERMFQFVADARRAGMLIHGCFMVGFPGEDAAALQRTMDLAVKLNPDTAQFYPMMVYPGTEAFEDYQQRGWITAASYREWLTPEGLHNCVVRNEHFNSAELVRWCDNARRQFYLRPRYFAFKLWQMILHPHERRRTLKAANVFLKHLLLGSKV